MELRPYQTAAIDAIETAWETIRRPAVVLPTGMGKTVIFAKLAQRNAHRWPLILVHRDELVRQTVAKLNALAPELTVGVVKAERNEIGPEYHVVVASVQTLGREARLSQIAHDRFGLIIVDEAHHAPAESYRRILAYFGALPGDPAWADDGPYGVHSFPAVAVGFTATMGRGDSKKLGDVWQEVVFERDVMYGIVHGYLSDVRGKRVPLFDVDELRKRAGDLAEGDLEDLLNETDGYDRSAAAFIEHGRQDDGAFRPTIIFAPTVAAAHSFAESFNRHEIACEVVTGATPTDERQAIFERFRLGKTVALASCMVLTEGFDAPWASCAIMARPTTIASLYIQMVGRVLRPFPGKTDALVLDLVGATGRHKLASITSLLPGGEAPAGVETDDRPLSEIAETEPVTPSWLTGSAAEDVDLFQQSVSVWLKTTGGIWFLPTKAGYIFLKPDFRPDADPETWLIGKTASQYAKVGLKIFRYSAPAHVISETWGWLRSGMNLEYSMIYAEEIASWLDPSVSSRKASWRKKSNKISDRQREQLEKLKIPFADDITRDAASNLLSVHYASKILDERSR